MGNPPCPFCGKQPIPMVERFRRVRYICPKRPECRGLASIAAGNSHEASRNWESTVAAAIRHPGDRSVKYP
jgi:hypothetical protein